MDVVKYRKRGFIIYVVGIILGLLFTVAVVWADFEASLFDTSYPAEQRLTTLSCPVLITANETGIVKATFSNPHERAVTRPVRAHISEGYLTWMRNDETRLTLQAGETQTLEWPVTIDDAVWNRVVLVRVFALRSAPLASTTGTCGILTLGIPFLTGSQIVTGIIGLIILILVSGLVVWVKDVEPLDRTTSYLARAMAAVAALIGAGMLVGLSGTWILAGLLWIFTLVLIVTIVISFVLSKA